MASVSGQPPGPPALNGHNFSVSPPAAASASASPVLSLLSADNTKSPIVSDVVSDVAVPSPAAPSSFNTNTTTTTRPRTSHSAAVSSPLAASANLPSSKAPASGHGTYLLSQGSSQPSSVSATKPAARLPSGFPSPGREAMQTDQKFINDRAKLTFGIKGALPEAARRSVRDNWEKCLLGSDFHQAFVLNASIHHASPQAIQRGMRDFGKGLIAAAKTQIVEQMTTADLDQLMPLILSKASVAFYDKCLEDRLRTIDAKRLINALARAERLGYEPSDVTEVQDDEQDTAHSAKHSHPPSQPVSVTPAPANSGPLPHCGICFRRFPAQSAFDHHVKMKVCTALPSTPGGFKYNCQHCGQGFTTPMGLQYHNSNHVCGDFGEPVKQYAVNKRNSHGSYAKTPAPLPSRPAAQLSATSTPSLSKASSPGYTGTPGLTDSHGFVADPYAHLSPEQLAAMQSELREAEIKFGERMRLANLISDQAEKKTRLEGLGNSFSTKQSMIRKKYGVRLRIRRGKAEIQQERSRVHYKTSSELQADFGMTAGRRNGAAGFTAYHSNATGGSTPPIAWAPVNQVKSNVHGNLKRRFSGSQSPAMKRVAYDEMSGLGGTAGEAETKDPTFSKKEPLVGGGLGSKDEPMSLDGSSSESEGGSGSNDDGSDEDQDIPAVLPASVIQTLQRGSSAGFGADSRPGSRPGSSAEGGVASP